MLRNRVWQRQCQLVLLVATTASCGALGDEPSEPALPTSVHDMFVVGDSAVVGTDGMVWTLTPQQVVDLRDLGDRVSQLRTLGVQVRTNGDLEKYAKYAGSLMKRYDQTKNGVLEEEEWKRISSLQRGADSNGDKIITEVELLNVFAAYANRTTAGRNAGISEVAPVDSEKMEELDNQVSRLRDKLPLGIPTDPRYAVSQIVTSNPDFLVLRYGGEERIMFIAHLKDVRQRVGRRSSEPTVESESHPTIETLQQLFKPGQWFITQQGRGWLLTAKQKKDLDDYHASRTAALNRKAELTAIVGKHSTYVSAAQNASMRYDVNKDGALQADEVKAWGRELDDLDSDRDGEISLAELVVAEMAQGQAGPMLSEGERILEQHQRASAELTLLEYNLQMLGNELKRLQRDVLPSGTPTSEVAFQIAGFNDNALVLKLGNQRRFVFLSHVAEVGRKLTGVDENVWRGTDTLFSEEVLLAWQDAGAEFGWMGIDERSREFSFRAESTGLLKPLPACRFNVWKEGLIANLPAPDTPFAIDVRRTQFTNAGTKDLARMARLEYLDVSATRVTDDGLGELSGLSNLKFLSVYETQVTDAGLLELASLNSVQLLSLGRTAITDDGLKALAALSNLQNLNLHGVSELTDAGIADIAGMTGLVRLSISSTQVTDAALEDIARLKNLQHLTLGYTKVTDAGLKELAELKGLKSLGLDGTKVTSEGVKELKTALPDTEISSTINASRYRRR